MLTEQTILERIAQGETACGILRNELPEAEKRFSKLCYDMMNFIDDVNAVFPDAEYYTACGGFNLLLGNSHSYSGKAQQELRALSNDSWPFSVGDGDW